MGCAEFLEYLEEIFPTRLNELNLAGEGFLRFEIPGDVNERSGLKTVPQAAGLSCSRTSLIGHLRPWRLFSIPRRLGVLPCRLVIG